MVVITKIQLKALWKAGKISDPIIFDGKLYAFLAASEHAQYHDSTIEVTL